jgi:hypothetical protein
MNKDEAKRSVITVGEGRGFVVQGKRGLMVITCAHCLPKLPPASPVSYTHERTYSQLLAQLGDKPAVMAECLFVDPVADIAVLGPPDCQKYWNEADAHNDLVEELAPLPVIDASNEKAVWLLSLDGQWFRADVRITSSNLIFPGVDTEGGMSGSPVVTDEGAAIGIVASTHTNPRLIQTLPVWFAGKLSA